MTTIVGVVAACALTLAPAAASPRPGVSSPGRHQVVHRPRGPWYSVSAQARLGILLAGGAQVIQPIGFGAGFEIRIHGLPLGPFRFGVQIDLGHTRYLDRRELSVDIEGDTRRIVRWAALGHTDLTAGPSFQVVLGPVFMELGLGLGVGISRFTRPLGATRAEEEAYDDTTFLLRGGGHLAVPVRPGQSVVVGMGVHRYFSDLQVASTPSADPTEPAVPDTSPFDLMLDVYVGYHFMF